jgi:hypothetical protein
VGSKPGKHEDETHASIVGYNPMDPERALTHPIIGEQLYPQSTFPGLGVKIGHNLPVIGISGLIITLTEFNWKKPWFPLKFQKGVVNGVGSYTGQEAVNIDDTWKNVLLLSSCGVPILAVGVAIHLC